MHECHLKLSRTVPFMNAPSVGWRPNALIDRLPLYFHYRDNSSK
jgi:hypothetical protein